MESSILKPFKYVFFVLLGLAAAFGALKVFGPLVVQRSHLSQERDMLNKDNEYLSQEISELRRKQENFANDREYTELEARRQGRVHSREVIFDFNTTSRVAP